MEHTRITLLVRVRDPADTQAWGEFVALYQPLLTAYVRQRGLGEDDARDVVQDVFARLIKSLPEFELARHRGRFRTWLWQVCRSALCDWARRRRRQSRAEDAWLKRLSDAPSSRTGDSDAEWERLHRRRVLAFALEKIRSRSQPASWACFEGHLLQRKPSALVARELRLSTNAVNINCSRILTRIRTFCAEHLEDLANGHDALPGGP
jgi:RNA polymerase sigma-70 factor (ECF subfamily)